jgi:hypothetical protein
MTRELVHSFLRTRMSQRYVASFRFPITSKFLVHSHLDIRWKSRERAEVPHDLGVVLPQLCIALTGSETLAQLFCRGGWELAGEVLAHVRIAIFAAFPQRGINGLAPGGDGCWAPLAADNR